MGFYEKGLWLEPKKSLVTGVIKSEKDSPVTHYFDGIKTNCGLKPEKVFLVPTKEARVNCPKCRNYPFFFEDPTGSNPL